MLSIRDLQALAAAVEGVPVFGCNAGGAAERAGVRYGDVILEVNGQRTKNLDEYLEAALLDPDRMSLVVLRDGVEQSFDFELDLPARTSEEILEELVDRERSARDRDRRSRGQA